MAQAFDKQLQELLEDNRSGSREIAARAAAAMRSLLDDGELNRGTLINQLRLAARRLEKAHVSLAAVRSFCDAVLLILDAAPPREELARRLRELFEGWDEIYTSRLTLQIAAHLAPLLREVRAIVSHSRSRTVLEVLKHLQPRLTKVRIVQSISEPMREGIDMARDLAAAGLQVELIADAGMATAMASADLALTGVDRIGEDGMVNKLGTFALALAARHYGKPMVALGDVAKVNAGTAPEIEHHDPAELLAEPIPGVRVDNRYFELVPLELFSAIITEKGAFDAAAIRTMRASRAEKTVPAADEELR